MTMADMEKHPDSYMNDGPFINKLLIPVSTITGDFKISRYEIL